MRRNRTREPEPTRPQVEEKPQDVWMFYEKVKPHYTFWGTAFLGNQEKEARAEVAKALALDHEVRLYHGTIVWDEDEA